jgi:hypothetical protein
MKKIFTTTLLFIVGGFITHATAQAYRKGSLTISISEGSTFANYATDDISGPKPVRIYDEVMPGLRDPLVIQYGISKRWSIGLSSGNDIFTVNPSKFYGFSTSDNKVDVKTSELTFDVNYHVFINKRLDLSVYASTGLFSIKMQGNDGDNFYNHESNGTIVRYGTKAHYYFWKRLGAVGMISSYLANSSPKDVKGNSEAKMHTTTINGVAIEAGLCFRILK